MLVSDRELFPNGVTVILITRIPDRGALFGDKKGADAALDNKVCRLDERSVLNRGVETSPEKAYDSVLVTSENVSLMRLAKDLIEESDME